LRGLDTALLGYALGITGNVTLCISLQAPLKHKTATR